MRFNLISNLSNGVGLQKDYELLRRELEVRGHQVHGIQFNKPQMAIADINIFLETVVPAVFPYAAQQWAIPNPEWWFVGWNHLVYDLVLAKTRDCERIFRGVFGDKCQYLGWTATDMLDLAVPRHPKFLHVAGKSKFKNTKAVIDGCKLAKVQVTVVGEGPGGSHISEAALQTLMNSHLFHVMPSAYEGFGQVLHEALSVGQVLITTDAPPMNELEPTILIPSIAARPHHAGTLHAVSATGVEIAVQIALHMTMDEIAFFRFGARERYERDERQFRLNLDDVLKEAAL